MDPRTASDRGLVERASAKHQILHLPGSPPSSCHDHALERGDLASSYVIKFAGPLAQGVLEPKMIKSIKLIKLIKLVKLTI